MHPALQHTAHRPWPLPRTPWRWRQSWHDLAFLHWRIGIEKLISLIPSQFEIEEYDGSAWIGVVPFTMSDVMLRGGPALPGISSFPELNVRTYVQHEGRRGVWFFSLDAANRCAVWTARRLFHLPYHHAQMHVRRDPPRVHYSSRRRTGETFITRYEWTGPAATAHRGSLGEFLTERYCLYARGPDGRAYSADIHHAPWQLRAGQADIERNDYIHAAVGIHVSGAPLVHCAARQDVVVWPLRELVR